MKYAWIKAQGDGFPVTVMCKIMMVSSSAYYSWLKKPKTAREAENDSLTTKIEALFEDGRGVYGTRRLKSKLAEDGISGCHKIT